MAVAEKAAVLPKCRFRIDWSKSLEARMPQLGHLRSLSRLFQARAVLQAREGDTGGALRSAGLIFRMSEALKDEPVLISALVRYTLIDDGTRALRNAAGSGNAREAQARRLDDELASISLHDSMTKALQGDRAVAIVFFEDFLSGRVSLAPEDEESAENLRRLSGNPLVRLWLGNDEAYYLREMRKQIGISNLSYRELKRRFRDDKPDPPRFAFISSMLLPVYTRPPAARDRAIARLEGSQLFLGLLACRNRFGAYPASLDEMRTKLNWRIPLDPFSGKPFVYRRMGRGFVLYSIGEDLKDNGGVEPKTAPTKRSGDIVWKRDR
jgi:hypothetical protein